MWGRARQRKVARKSLCGPVARHCHMPTCPVQHLARSQPFGCMIRLISGEILSGRGPLEPRPLLLSHPSATPKPHFSSVSWWQERMLDSEEGTANSAGQKVPAWHLKDQAEPPVGVEEAERMGLGWG